MKTYTYLNEKTKEGSPIPIWFDNAEKFFTFVKENKPKGKFIYFFEVDEKYIKIGYSKSLEKRIKEHLCVLKERMGKIGIIGHNDFNEAIELIIHARLFDTKYIAENVYDTETYSFNMKIDEVMPMLIDVIRYLYAYNSELLDIEGEFGFNIFYPETTYKSYGAFVKKYIL